MCIYEHCNCNVTGETFHFSETSRFCSRVNEKSFNEVPLNPERLKTMPDTEGAQDMTTFFNSPSFKCVIILILQYTIDRLQKNLSFRRFK